PLTPDGGKERVPDGRDLGPRGVLPRAAEPDQPSFGLEDGAEPVSAGLGRLTTERASLLGRDRLLDPQQRASDARIGVERLHEGGVPLGQGAKPESVLRRQASRAWARSAIRSSASSTPTE